MPGGFNADDERRRAVRAARAMAPGVLLAGVAGGLAMHSLASHADGLVHRHYPDAIRLLSRDAGWRTRGATDKQLELPRKRGLPAPPRLSRGQASWMLSYVLRPRT